MYAIFRAEITLNVEAMEIEIKHNIISSRDTDEERVMQSKGDSLEVMFNDKADKVSEESFQLLFSGYKIGLETSN